MQQYKVIGVMSGTSLDGVDLAYCTFQVHNNKWQFSIEKATTLPYSAHWKKKLERLINEPKSAIEIADIEFGKLLGELISSFIEKNKLQPDFICSHGHTILHQPEKGITVQIGCGKEIAKSCNVTTINNFRALDVSLGGQGAPLVPIGDQLLFQEYDFCLNLGGFANISFDEKGTRKAFDICPANLPINYLAEKLGHTMDKNGAIAKSGETDFELLEQLNSLFFYSSPPPKSLGKEWLDSQFMPILEATSTSVENKLRTVIEHIALQISKSIYVDTGKLLITGGGAFNSFLLERLSAHTSVEIIVPPKETVEYKEALIFGLLGILKHRNEPNCLASVTGAKNDNCGGEIHFPSSL